MYTNKYDNPIKFNPVRIKYADMDKNKPIKNKTDTIGFLLIITKIPNNMAIMYNKSKLYTL